MHQRGEHASKRSSCGGGHPEAVAQIFTQKCGLHIFRCVRFCTFLAEHPLWEILSAAIMAIRHPEHIRRLCFFSSCSNTFIVSSLSLSSVSHRYREVCFHMIRYPVPVTLGVPSASLLTQWHSVNAPYQYLLECKECDQNIKSSFLGVLCTTNTAQHTHNLPTQT
jgi:hypothetical protein